MAIRDNIVLRSLLLIILLVLSVLINIIVLHTPYERAVLYLLVALLYGLLTKPTITPKLRVGYIQTGAAAGSTLVIFFVLRFITSHISVIIIATLLSFMLINAFSKALHRKRDQVIVGMIINAVVIIFFVFFLLSDSTFHFAELAPMVTGYGLHLTENLYGILVLAILILLFLYLSLEFSSELSLLAQGSAYFETTGWSYRLFHRGLGFLGDLLFTIIFLLIGWLGGIGPYLGKSRTDNFKTDLLRFICIMIYIQVLAAISAYGEPIFIIAIAPVMTYALYYRTQRRGE